ncbi:MAG: serine O-acetyltransferase [Actinomycetota bacterium]|jgi:serine O-acetyltransferase
MAISTRSDFVACIRDDAAANGVEKLTLGALAKRPTLRFIVVLRFAEWLTASSSGFARLPALLARAYLMRISVRLGFSIPLNVCGPGLALPHWGSIVISGHARNGRNVRIHSGVNVGGTPSAAPVIGDNCYLGPGAKLFGRIELGPGCTVGANAVVTRSFPACTVLVGVPARPIDE